MEETFGALATDFKGRPRTCPLSHWSHRGPLSFRRPRETRSKVGTGKCLARASYKGTHILCMYRLLGVQTQASLVRGHKQTASTVQAPHSPQLAQLMATPHTHWHTRRGGCKSQF